MQPEKILIRGVNWLGDAVMTTPALQRLREAYPAASITMLAPAKLADLWLHHPSLNSVLRIEAGEGLFSVASKIRREQFQTAVVFPNSPRSALEVFLGGVPRRVGYAKSWRNLFLTDALTPNPFYRSMRKRTESEVQRLVSQPGLAAPDPYPEQAHHVYHYLRIVQALGADTKPVPPRIGLAEQELQAVKEKWSLDRESTTWIGLNPGAEYGPAKRWPAERFSAAAIALGKRTGCRFMIFGAQGDAPLASQVAAEIENGLGDESSKGSPRVLNLAGKTSLRELCALLRLCSVVITNDSGPMHLAAAVGTPVVGLFGSTSPELTGPGISQPNANILLKTTAPCAPCFLRQCPIDFRCMREHTAEQVVEAVLRLPGIAKIQT
ncbi:MAG: Lipopolysaccharide heptosyltransferase [Verrucomicrobiales bacterium]|nr:Lipopolysaccharide heptosyltransferase [Verrucomicrobiales bacterium]